jgi:hypothetical protein
LFLVVVEFQCLPVAAWEMLVWDWDVPIIGHLMLPKKYLPLVQVWKECGSRCHGWGCVSRF